MKIITFPKTLVFVFLASFFAISIFLKLSTQTKAQGLETNTHQALSFNISPNGSYVATIENLERQTAFDPDIGRIVPFYRNNLYITRSTDTITWTQPQWIGTLTPTPRDTSGGHSFTFDTMGRELLAYTNSAGLHFHSYDPASESLSEAIVSTSSLTSNPSIHVAATAKLLISYIQENALYLAVSSDNGTTWQTSRVGTETFAPADTSITTFSGDAYAISVQNKTSGILQAFISQDQGATWQTSTIATGAGVGEINELRYDPLTKSLRLVFFGSTQKTALFATSQNGIKWKISPIGEANISEPYNGFAINYLSKNNRFVVFSSSKGYVGATLFTSNNGRNWSQTSLNIPEITALPYLF